MKNLDCNQIMIVINFKIIGDGDKNKKNYIYFFLNLKNFLQFGKATVSKPNIYYIVYDIYIYIYRLVEILGCILLGSMINFVLLQYKNIKIK